MAYTKLGRIRPVHKGEWSASTAYTALEMVRSNNVSYIANKDVPAGTPLNNGEYWAVVLDVSDVIAEAEEATAHAKDIMNVKANALAASATGNPVQFYPDEGSVIKPVLTFEPVQEGSGDPYPAGGGKNLLENTATTQTINGVTFTVNADGTVTANGTATADAPFVLERNIAIGAGEYILSGCPVGGAYDKYYLYIINPGYNDFGSGVTATIATGDTPTCAIMVKSGYTASNLVFKPMIRLASITDATYAPYSNIRPFTGRTSAELVRCGKNLAEKVVYGYVTNGGYFNMDGNSITAIARVVKGQNYKISCKVALDRLSVAKSETVDLANNTPLTDYKYYGDLPSVFETQFTAEFTGIAAIYVKSTKDETAKDSLQLELGSTASAFAPYQGDTYALDFGQTVYGGTLDWNKGLVTEDWAMTEYAANTAPRNIETFDTYKRLLYLAPGAPNVASNVDIACNLAKMDAVATDPWTCRCRYGYVYITVPLDHPDYLTDTLQICYKLATPITIQLTPQQITALAGVNTVYGDADGMTVGYNKSLAKAFEEVLAELAAMKAAATTTE